MYDGHNINILLEDSSWHDWWNKFYKSIVDISPHKMQDLMSGEWIFPALFHDKIRGLARIGGQATGSNLSSADKDAFKSYGFESGQNAPLSVENMVIYRAALEHLIKNNCKIISNKNNGIAILYWYSRDIPTDYDLAQDILGTLKFDNSQENEEKKIPEMKILQAEDKAQKTLNLLESGERPEYLNCRYYSMVISANGGRIILYDWREIEFKKFIERVLRWQDDCKIIDIRTKKDIKNITLDDIASILYDESVNLYTKAIFELYRCIIMNYPIPNKIATIINEKIKTRILSKKGINPTYFAILKLFVRRNLGMDIKPELNENETNPAYIAGRIFALLEYIQYRAAGTSDAMERYYAAAATVPGLTLGRLIRMAKIAYLPKIEEKEIKYWAETKLADLFAKINNIPNTLTPAEQTLFALGFYHQKAFRGTKKEEPENGTGKQEQI